MATSSLVVKNILGNCRSNLSILAANYSCRRAGFSLVSINNSFMARRSCYYLPMLLCSTYSSSTVPVPTPTPTERKGIPWLMLQPPESTSVYKFYRLSKKDVKVVAVESTQDPSDSHSEFLGSPFQGWMAYIRRKDCQFFLFNPISGQKIILPPVETSLFLENVCWNDTSGLVESFTSNDDPNIHVSPEDFSKRIIRDVVLSSSPMDDGCIALIIYGHKDKLAFCRIRDGYPSRWIPLDSPFRQYTQIVYHSGKKLFYTFSTGEDVFINEFEAWDLHNDPIKRFHFADQAEVLERISSWPASVEDDKDLLEMQYSRYWVRRKYMVYDHQSQELFVVIRHVLDNNDVMYAYGVPHRDNDDILPYKTITFDVFKVDFINDDLVKLEYLKDSIGKRAIFLGKKRGFALSTTEFSKLRPGCIYFADDEYEWKYNYGGHDMGIFDYEDNSIIDEIPSIPPSSNWFIPDA